MLIRNWEALVWGDIERRMKKYIRSARNARVLILFFTALTSG
jgi:hypothetical protein